MQLVSIDMIVQAPVYVQTHHDASVDEMWWHFVAIDLRWNLGSSLQSWSFEYLATTIPSAPLIC